MRVFILLSLLICIILVSLISVTADNVNIYQSTIDLVYSETKPGNLFPNFLFQQGSIEGGSVGVKIGGGRGTPKAFSPDDSCGDDIFEGAMEDMRSPQLPYLTQDQWTCDRQMQSVPVWIMESDDLKVTITPQYDGKVWAIYDKNLKRDLLYNSKAHQPANIGALKAWTAGGAEWNWSPGIIGHSAFSETEVHMAQVETDLGSVLRVYEFDRYNGTVWQVDMMIHNGTFFAHPKVTNPTNKDLRGYWWTCVAVESQPSTRIFTPATHVAETSRDPMRNAPWPHFAEAIENTTFQGYENAFPTDNSFIGNHQIGDMFLRIPDTVYTPYIGHTQTDGYVYVHGHPLNGTKFYTWGQSGPGRFMQDFLAGGLRREGDYTELQIGPAPTQMQNFPVPANSVRQWTEWYRGFQGQPKILYDKDYSVAMKYVDTWIQSPVGMPKDLLAVYDNLLTQVSNKPPSKILVEGQPWGALEELALGSKLSMGLDFKIPSDTDSLKFKEMRPWMEMLTIGKFSAESLLEVPLSFQTTDVWYQRLLDSKKNNGLDWLLAYHLAINSAERGNLQEPIDLFTQSFSQFPMTITARNLAVLQSTPADAWVYYLQAVGTFSGVNSYTAYLKKNADVHDRILTNLISEMSYFLQQNYDEFNSEVEKFIFTTVPALVKGVDTRAQEVDSFLTLQIKHFIATKRYSNAKTLLAGNCFPTYAKARSDLMSFWFNVVEGLALQSKNDVLVSQGLPTVSSLTKVEGHQARKANRIPDNIGCQYASEYCDNYW